MLSFHLYCQEESTSIVKLFIVFPINQPWKLTKAVVHWKTTSLIVFYPFPLKLRHHLGWLQPRLFRLSEHQRAWWELCIGYNDPVKELLFRILSPDNSFAQFPYSLFTNLSLSAYHSIELSIEREENLRGEFFFLFFFFASCAGALMECTYSCITFFTVSVRWNINYLLIPTRTFNHKTKCCCSNRCEDKNPIKLYISHAS